MNAGEKGKKWLLIIYIVQNSKKLSLQKRKKKKYREKKPGQLGDKNGRRTDVRRPPGDETENGEIK